MGGLIKYNLLPQETEEQKIAFKVYEFNRYLKAMCKIDANSYKLDNRAIDFLISIGYDELINDDFILNAKVWDKKYQNWMDIFREWINKNKEEILDKLNTEIFIEDWNKYAKGTISAWEMASQSKEKQQNY